MTNPAIRLVSTTEQLVELHRITSNLTINCRARGLCEDTLHDYAEAMERGDVFPPVDLVEDPDGKLYLWDGFHRVEAAHATGAETIWARIQPGTKRDAFRLAASANAHHGLRRTLADKRAAAARLLLDPEWSQWSNRQIAEWCGVSHTSVSRYRRDLEVNNEAAPAPTQTRKHVQAGKVVRRVVPARPLPPPALEEEASSLSEPAEVLLAFLMRYIPEWGRPPTYGEVREATKLTAPDYKAALDELVTEKFVVIDSPNGYLRVLRNTHGAPVRLRWERWD